MRRAQGKPVTVWAVNYSTKGPGRYGDGQDHAYFRREADARDFATGKVHYGSPAAPIKMEISRDVAMRHGIA